MAIMPKVTVVISRYFFSAIHDNKRSVVDLKNFEEYCVYLRKAIVALLF